MIDIFKFHYDYYGLNYLHFLNFFVTISQKGVKIKATAIGYMSICNIQKHPLKWIKGWNAKMTLHNFYRSGIWR